MIKPVGLINGHFECRSLDETLPIFTDLLAMEVVERENHLAVCKHPNTDWLLIVHEGGPDAPPKPHNNHYGFRVAHHTEVEAAYRYISAHKDRYRIKSVTKPHEAHFAYSIYMKEPGGNDLEIEYYNPRASAHGRQIAATPWTQLLPEERFPGRGYIPQAMSHGTLQCDDKEASRRFYEEVLGLEIAGGGHRSLYIKHPSTPWYIVVLPDRHRQYLAPVNRFTLKFAAAEQVAQRYDEFKRSGKEIGVTHLDPLQEKDGRVSFIFSDLDRNWWEFTS
ncbi:MAG TPA: VOC family protein [Candidatus Acidoferrales bacterium]|nr:VOC family protein [Candidatus Acidoferrales bacterium]